jgi:transcription elongation factor Elf1
MSDPYIGFNNDTLEKSPRISKGYRIRCPHCNKLHLVECGTDKDGKENTFLLFYQCGDKSYLAGINGRSVVRTKADIHGTV